MANLRKLARGRECQIRIPGVCNGNPETTVLCHLNGGGMGIKEDDILAAWGCSSCHDAVDGRGKHSAIMYNSEFSDGIFNTIRILVQEDVICY
jgi:hypothetical protein